MTDKIFQKVMTYGVAIFFFLALLWILLFPITDNGVYHQSLIINNSWQPQSLPDEMFYKLSSENFTVDNIRYRYSMRYEMKPITFLLLEKLLFADTTYILSRLFNVILVIVNTFLIYKLTKNKLAIIYPLFPIFLNSMWLTVETVELTFLLLGLCYKERQGIFVGLATIFRPYSLLYTILLSKKHVLRVLIIGISFSIVLLALGLFFPYLFELIKYSYRGTEEVDILAGFMLIPLIIMGCRNKEMLKYSIIAAMPLMVKLFGHYFLPVYTFLFMGFLLNMNEDLQK